MSKTEERTKEKISKRQQKRQHEKGKAEARKERDLEIKRINAEARDSIANINAVRESKLKAVWKKWWDGNS